MPAAPKPDHLPASLYLPATRSTCHSCFWLPCPSLTCTPGPRESDTYIFTPQPPRAELSCCALALGSYRQVFFRKRTDLGIIAHGQTLIYGALTVLVIAGVGPS